MTPITGSFLVLNTLLWLVYLGSGQSGSWRAAFLVPNDFWPVSLVTSQFIHQSALHLGLNMLLLWAFGRRVEQGLGSALFSVLYLGSGAFAGLLHVAVAHLFHAEAELGMAAGGASGAIAGVMGAYAAIYPHRRLRIPALGLDVAGVTVILVWLGWEAAQAVVTLQRGVELGVGHWAHVGGLVCGLVVGPALSGGGGGTGSPRSGSTPGSELPESQTSPIQVAAQGAAAAVERLTRIGAREHALALYRQAIEEGHALPLPGPVEFRIGAWLVEEKDWAAACDAFLSVAHGEAEPDLAATALHQATQIAEEHLRRPQLAERLRQDLLFRFPQSRWGAHPNEPPGSASPTPDTPEA